MEYNRHREFNKCKHILYSYIVITLIMILYSLYKWLVEKKLYMFVHCLKLLNYSCVRCALSIHINNKLINNYINSKCVCYNVRNLFQFILCIGISLYKNSVYICPIKETYPDKSFERNIMTVVNKEQVLINSINFRRNSRRSLC